MVLKSMKRFFLLHLYNNKCKVTFLTCQTGKDEKIVNTLCWQGHKVMLMEL